MTTDPAPASPEPLAPCPFCGGHVSTTTNGNLHIAICQNSECNASTPYYATRTDAIAAWNRRAPPSAPTTGEYVRKTTEIVRMQLDDFVQGKSDSRCRAAREVLADLRAAEKEIARLRHELVKVAAYTSDELRLALKERDEARKGVLDNFGMSATLWGIALAEWDQLRKQLEMRSTANSLSEAVVQLGHREDAMRGELTRLRFATQVAAETRRHMLKYCDGTHGDCAFCDEARKYILGDGSQSPACPHCEDR